MQFINNLQKTISFKFISILGYIFFIFYIVLFLFVIPKEIKNAVDPDFGVTWTLLIIAIFSIIYSFIWLFTIILGFIEYYMNKKNGKFYNDKEKISVTIFFFVIGLIFSIIPVLVLIVGLSYQ